MSVVVCAFATERLEQTVACVLSVLAQRPAPEQVLVVVDHNDSLRRELRHRLPRAVEILPNERDRGLSNARNTAVEHSRGDAIVFIDDDALAPAGWLAGLIAPFRDSEVVGVGGHARPIWQSQPPGWFPDEFLWVVGCSYGGLPEAGPVRNPLGCNMAFRAAVFERVGLFDPGMGRLGSLPLGCEETEFCVRAAREIAGARIVLVSGATIGHHVPDRRATARYLLSRCLYEGISKALVRRLGDSRSLGTERTYLRRTLPARVRRNLRCVLTGPERGQGLQQAAAVIGGVAAAAAGYALGTVAFGLRRRQAKPPRYSRQPPPPKEQLRVTALEQRRVPDGSHR